MTPVTGSRWRHRGSTLAPGVGGLRPPHPIGRGPGPRRGRRARVRVSRAEAELSVRDPGPSSAAQCLPRLSAPSGLPVPRRQSRPESLTAGQGRSPALPGRAAERLEQPPGAGALLGGRRSPGGRRGLGPWLPRRASLSLGPPRAGRGPPGNVSLYYLRMCRRWSLDCCARVGSLVPLPTSSHFKPCRAGCCRRRRARPPRPAPARPTQDRAARGSLAARPAQPRSPGAAEPQQPAAGPCEAAGAMCV